MMKTNRFAMQKQIKVFLLLLTLCLTSYSLHAQEKTITGNVTDFEDSSPLPGVSIVIKGTTTGTITDLKGNYTLKVPGNESVVVFNFVGYSPMEEIVGTRSSIDVKMQFSAVDLDEVLVIGYGTIKKSDLTGAVGSVDVEELNKVASPTVDQALSGKLSGVFVTQNSATPGGGSSIRIRGAGGINNSEPLYVIDGVLHYAQENEYTSPLANLSSDDIESIEVLKDASSAAIYGARGANGVVIVTTKSGKKDKGTIAYSGYYGIQNLTKQQEVMNATEWENFVSTSYINAGEDDPIANPGQYGNGTNWLEETRNKNAPTQNHQLSFSGGNQNSSNFFSMGYSKTEGTLKWAEFERYTIRDNYERKIKEILTVGANVSYVRTKQRVNNNNRGHENSFYPRVQLMSPALDAYDDEGNLAPIPNEPQYGIHAPPTWVGQYEGETRENSAFIGSAYTRLQIIKPITWNTRISVRNSGVKKYNAQPTRDLGNSFDDQSTTKRSIAVSNGYTLETTFDFNKTFGQNTVTFMVGASTEDNHWEVINSTSKWNDDGWVITGDFAAESYFDNSIQENSMTSIFSRLFYNFGDRYLVTGNLRRDGSSKFGKNNKFGVFPSVSGAWRVSNEAFFPQDFIINDFKLRGGWGQIGNDDIPNHAGLQKIGSNYFYPFGNVDGTVSTGSAPNSGSNPDLKWETVTTSSVGFDLSLLRGKVFFSTEYYTNKREDMLYGVPSSGTTGLSNGGGLPTVFQNAGSLTNKGFEFSINYRDKKGEFTYGIGANLTTLKNEITDLGAATEFPGYEYNNMVWSKSVVGGSLGEFYGYQWDGVFQDQAEIDAHATQEGAAPGDFRFRDIAGPRDENGNPTGPDGVIDENDQTAIGNPHPDMFYGITLELGYKGIDFSMQFAGVQGADVMNVSKQVLMDGSRGNSNKLKEFTNYWTGPGSTNEYPRAYHGDPNRNMRNSSYFVEDGSYFRCQLIQLGYTFPSALVSKAKISNLRVYASLQNAFTITGYSGPDPDVGAQNGSSSRMGMDMFVYPKPRTLLFGINLSF